MLLFVILFAVLVIAAAATMIARNRRLRSRSRKGSRYFSVSLANPDAPGTGEDGPR